MTPPAPNDSAQTSNGPAGPEREAQSSRGQGQHLVLVGLPGAGKTTVGRLLAGELGLPFLDFDVELEGREGLPVAEIFNQKGEAYFRTLERKLTAELRDKPQMVVSPGGGWMVDPANVALIRPPARIIHLAVTPEEAVARLGTAAAERPLLRKNPQQQIARLWEERSRVYALADAVIETQGIAPQEVAKQLSELSKGWISRPG